MLDSDASRRAYLTLVQAGKRVKLTATLKVGAGSDSSHTEVTLVMDPMEARQVAALLERFASDAEHHDDD